VEFVTTNPRISKPRVGGSNPPGRANNLSIINISVIVVNMIIYGFIISKLKKSFK